jgi:hypothetical protein
MFDLLRESYEMLRDQVWFFRFFVVIGVVCVYRTLLHYVLRSNHCANPFCSKCLSIGSARSRAINMIKSETNDDDDDNDHNSSLRSIVLTNLLQHDRLCQRNDEKPTVYFHRGLSSRSTLTLPDENILLDHYDDLRQEMSKFLQDNAQISWTNFYLFQNGEEISNQCKLFPKLNEILYLLPNAIAINHPHCLFGNCFLTRLTSDSDKDLQNSNGLSNCVLRLHFGLICDEQSCASVIVNKRRHLPIKNKSIALYNDALEHSIRNPTEKQQIFLNVDFWHPDISIDMRKQLASIFHNNLA